MKVNYCKFTGLVYINEVGLTIEQIEGLEGTKQAFEKIGQFEISIKIKDQVQKTEVELSLEDIDNLSTFAHNLIEEGKDIATADQF